MRSKLRRIRGYPAVILLKSNPLFREGFLAVLFNKNKELDAFWRTRVEFHQDPEAPDCIRTKGPAIFKSKRNGDHLINQIGVLLDGEIVLLSDFPHPYVIQNNETFQVEIRIQKDSLSWHPKMLQPSGIAQL